MSKYKLVFILLGIIIVSVVSGIFISDFISSDDESQDANFVQPEITNTGDGELLDLDVGGDLFLSTATLYLEDEDRELETMGSAFLYTDNHLVTNEHVIRGHDEVLIQYGEGEWAEGEVVGADEHTDIGVVEPDRIPDEAEPLPIQEELPEKTQPVVAIGSPRGLDDSVSTGVISGVERNVQIETRFSVPDTIQTDAALNRGNSGGPLLNTENSAVVGVNRATEGENIGYAVSARMADQIAESLIESGEHEHSYLGVQTIELNPLTESDFNISDDIEHGIIVTETFDDGPGGEAFLSDSETEQPDIIKKINDEEILNNEDLSSYLLRNTEPGESVDFEVYRNNDTMDVSVELASRPEAE